MSYYNNNNSHQHFDDEDHHHQNHQQQQQNNFRAPAPLQPAALTRSDNDGMYVAVGPSAASRNNNNNSNQQQQFTRSTSQNTGLVHTPHDNDNQRSISQQQDYYHTAGGGGGRPDGGTFYSQPLENENHTTGNNTNTLRDAREPYVKSRIDYDVSANEGKFRHHRVLMRDNDGEESENGDDGKKFGRRSTSAGRRGGRSPQKGTPPRHFPYASGHVKYGIKQHWLAGYTCWDWCSNAASCLDGCFCMWCINGMQWRRLHAKPRTEGGGRFEVFYGVAEDEGDKEMNRKYRTEGGKNNHKNDHHNSDEDEDNDGEKIPEGERHFMEAHSENIFDKCARIDWGCCLISCLGDMITCPLLLTPLGSAAAQFHIRRELRARYNLVAAPGSPSAEELEKMEIEQMEKQLQRREEAAKEKERISFERKKFNRAPPQPSPGGGGASKPTPGQLQNDSYDYKFSKNETNPGDADENNNAKNKNNNKNANNVKKDQDAEKEKSSSSSCISDETKEYLISWCCTPCSTAQVQREMTMRGEWPGGYWTKPMRVRADLAPGRGVREALRAFASLSPQRQHQTIDYTQPSMSSNANTPRRNDNETTTTTKVVAISNNYNSHSNNVKKIYPSLMSEVPPSRAGPQQPPPTPNEKRYQGSGAKESDVIRNDNVPVIELDNHRANQNINNINNDNNTRNSNNNNNNENNITPGNNDDDAEGNNENFDHQRQQEYHHQDHNFKMSSPPVRSPEHRRQSDSNNMHQPTPPSAQAEREHDGEEDHHHHQQQHHHDNEHNIQENNNNNINDNAHGDAIPQRGRSYSPDSPMKPTPGLGFRNRDQTIVQ